MSLSPPRRDFCNPDTPPKRNGGTAADFSDVTPSLVCGRAMQVVLGSFAAALAEDVPRSTAQMQASSRAHYEAARAQLGVVIDGCRGAQGAMRALAILGVRGGWKRLCSCAPPPALAASDGGVCP